MVQHRVCSCGRDYVVAPEDEIYPELCCHCALVEMDKEDKK